MSSSRPLSPSSPDFAAEFGQFLEHLEDGVILLDRAWRIAYANATARHISRIEPGQLNGPSHWELYPATVGTPQEAIYRRSMEERISLEHEFYYPPYDIWISLRTYPVPMGIAVHYRDITRIRSAEARRDESALQLGRVLGATSDAIAVLDRNYDFVFVNQRARRLLAPSGEVMGRNLWAAFPESVYPDSPYVHWYRRAMDERAGGSFEAFYPEPLNTWFAVDVHPDGDEGIILFFRDITAARASAKNCAARLPRPSARRPRSRPSTVPPRSGLRSSIPKSSAICA
jgi:PAS domain-containing protein